MGPTPVSADGNQREATCGSAPNRADVGWLLVASIAFLAVAVFGIQLYTKRGIYGVFGVGRSISATEGNAVDNITLINALEAATDDHSYHDPGGWRSLIDEAIERHEVVCEDHLSEELHGLEIGGTDVKAPKPAKSGSSLFITDVLMAQNGVEFVAGVDTYNGTTAYCSYEVYKRCGGNELLKINLRVAHVGGGQLQIHGLWAKALLMNHGNPMSLDIVVGDFRVMSCECLLGIPALSNMKGMIDCHAGLMDFIDDDGEVQIFGKNRSKIADIDDYTAAITELREKRRGDKPPTFTGGLESRRKARRPLRKGTGAMSPKESCIEACSELDSAVASKARNRQSAYYMLLLEKVIRKINDCIEGLSELGQADLCVWCAVEKDVWPWATGLAVNRMYPVLHQARLDQISRHEKCGQLVHTFVRCLGRLKEDYKEILQQLEHQPSIRGGTEAHHKTNSSNVGASETLADGAIRPGISDPESPEGQALLSYIKWKAKGNLPHRTYERDHGIARPAPSVDDSNYYGKNEFLTFVRESTREASTMGIQPLCQQWYGKIQDIPWLQLALTWLRGGTGSTDAKNRFVDAYDGSDLSSYDTQRRSVKTVEFAPGVGDKSLEAMEVKPVKNYEPSDLASDQDLIDHAVPADEEEIQQVLGGIQADIGGPIDGYFGKHPGISTEGWTNYSEENCQLEYLAETSVSALLETTNPSRRWSIPIELVMDGCEAEVIDNDQLGGDGLGLALNVHNLEAAKRSLAALESDVLCAVGTEESRRLSIEEKDAMLAKYTEDMFHKMPHITKDHVENIDRCHENIFDEWKKVAGEMGIDKKLFLIKDSQWDHDHACRIELKDEISQLPRVDYRRQPMHLLQIAVRMFKVLLQCGFYDRGQVSYSIPAILIPKRGASKKTGLNPDGTIGDFRVVGDSTQSNSITKDICYPTAHLEDSIASINEVAIEAHRQERCREKGIHLSIDDDRSERPMMDHEPPKSALVSAVDITKAFHRQRLSSTGISRDVCSLNYRGLGVLRALRCSQGPKQVPASWCRFISELLSTTGMLWGAGNQEPMKPDEEARLKKFIGDHTGDYESTVPHSFLICYVDDFLFVSSSDEQLRRQCLTLIWWMKEKQLYSNPIKSKIGCQSVRFLGFCVGYNLLFGDPERVKAMALVPEPITKKEVRRFIGGTGFYSHLVDNFAGLCAPLHRCTKNDVPDGDIRGHWYIDLAKDDEAYGSHWKVRSTGEKVEKSKHYLVSTQTGFEMIKSRLCVGALLTGLCLKARQYWVCGDSSELGFGGVLAVMGDDGKLHPIAYHSVHYNEQGQRRASVAREAFCTACLVHEWRWALLGTQFNFILITDCQCLETARKKKSINSGFISRIALKLDEFPGMKFYWREGHSSLLHTPDMLSRALYEYDGSKLPDQNGYAGPFEYRDCPVFNVLNGIWDPDVLIASVCWDDSSSDPVEEMDVEFGAILSKADTSFDEICGLIVSDLRCEDWMRTDAADLLQIEGDAFEVTGDGSEVVCNVNAELAIAQRKITNDFLLHTACCRDPEVASICGLQVSRGGKVGWNHSTAAYESIGCLSEIGLDDPLVYVAGIFDEHFQTDGKSYADTVVAAAGSKRSKAKGAKKGTPTPAKGKREGNVWIAAENDNFNKILVALGLWDEQSTERAKLFRLNPHLPCKGGARANTPLKAGTRVNLTSQALKNMTPDKAKSGESGLSLHQETFEAPKQVTTLFQAKDYLSCDDIKVVNVYKRLQGQTVDDKLADVSNYYLTEDGYLMHLDRVTNMMATVVPTKSAQEKLVRMFHLEFDNHPHYRQQVHMMRQHCTWRGMAKAVKEFERGCECNAWKTRTKYQYGPLQLFSRAVEPNVTWHMDFIMGLPPCTDGASGHCLSAILSVTDAFSGMVWLLPVTDSISARETGALIMKRIILEEARGLPTNLVCDRDQRYAGEAMRHIYELAGCRLTHTSGGRSTANGKVERIHRTVWRLLEGVGIDQHRWVERLPFVVYHLRTSPVMAKDGYSPVEIESGMQPRSPVPTSQGLARMRREATERDTQEHLRDLATLRDEVADAAELAADHYKARFDERTSTWKDEELLLPGKKVWLEMRGIDMPADSLMPTLKLRPRYMGPVTIVRRRRHWTFEVDIGNTKHHNVYHISRLKPYFGPDDEGEPIAAFPEPERKGPSTGEGKSFKVERIVGHKGKRGTPGHKYLVKWKGYGPFHTSWEPASDVKANQSVQRYEAELIKKRQYLDGVIDDASSEKTDEGGTRLDAEAYNRNDSETLGLLCPVAPTMLLWVAAIWNDRNMYASGH